MLKQTIASLLESKKSETNGRPVTAQNITPPSTMYKVFVVEDDEFLSKLIKKSLEVGVVEVEAEGVVAALGVVLPAETTGVELVVVVVNKSLANTGP